VFVHRINQIIYKREVGNGVRVYMNAAQNEITSPDTDGAVNRVMT
jgi:hypothetical protein